MKSMISDGDCLCNRPSGEIFVEVLGQRVGLSGIEELFKRWHETGREPSELSITEVLTTIREKNHISETVEYAYVEAVRTYYAAWLKRIKKDSQNAES